MAINYSKTNWVNGQPPAISASNLNKMETGIKYACDGVDVLDDFVVEEGDTTVGGQAAKYRKWNSGLCECWMNDWGATMNAGVAWAGGYYHAQSTPAALPSFGSNWVLKSSTPSNTKLEWVVGCIVNDGAFTLYMQNGASSYVSGTEVKLSLVFEGTWE